MEARIADFRQEPISDKELQEKLIAARENRGMKFSAIAEAIGISRTALSQFANNALPIREPYRTALIEHLNAMAEPPAAGERRSGYKQHLELYQTTEFRDAIGWCQKAVENRKMGVMIGYPGSGKTTVLRQFGALTPGARYIECWPGMRMSDLLRAIANAAEITISGNNYVKAQQIVAGLRSRTDIVLMFDECEYLKKWDVDKFEIIRKIWDNTSTPVIFAGTQELENILTRGGGRGNLAQLYRRKWEIKLEGVRGDEIRAILRDYNVTGDAAEMLVKIATDARHGGMGNFAEVLGMCLEAVQGGLVDGAAVQGAKEYKLLY